MRSENCLDRETALSGVKSNVILSEGKVKSRNRMMMSVGAAPSAAGVARDHGRMMFKVDLEIIDGKREEGR